MGMLCVMLQKSNVGRVEPGMKEGFAEQVALGSISTLICV